MRELGLVAVQPRAYKCTTLPGDAPTPAPDLLERDFTAEQPGQRLVGDITYLRTGEGWLYLATVIATDRCRTTNPDTGHDLWYSGKHRAHGGSVAVVCDPDGFPVAVSDVQPGSAHDLAAARATGFLGALYAAAALLGLPALADKGYAGAGAGIQTPTKGRDLHPDNVARNELIGCLRAQGERGIALLKTHWKALSRIRLYPQRIGAIVGAALVLTTIERPIR
jgi:DDE superfamily endonuclease